MLGSDAFALPSSPYRPAARPAVPTTSGQGRHRRSGRPKGRWHRHLLAYRDVDILHSPAPRGDALECLLLVHIRRVVGQVTYQVCEDCSEGVITEVHLDASFAGSGLDTRALSHLRTRHPGISWHSTLDHRLTRDVLRRMLVPGPSADGGCPHTRTAVDDER